MIAIVGAGALWWWNSQSPAAALDDGSYACTLVDIGSDGKYTQVTSESGTLSEGTAEVQNGKVVRIDAAGGSLALNDLTIQPRGTTHFRVFEGQVGALADPVGMAIACTHTGN
ncbi:hypothetical protein [uncultured Microbacterium sp.]|uniref:hypothetical protein n=1 Tax=uncultured Microbacterium sp. TaxID=191216 RepID=UPI0026053840|nr:hypothetical protein [uncultured Microbacterium sp.]